MFNMVREGDWDGPLPTHLPPCSTVGIRGVRTGALAQMVTKDTQPLRPLFSMAEGPEAQEN